ncbi:MAG: hypothetical protein QOG46_1430 [Pseudonocardiales bacterium]|nr:hypothetical protein [Pseudonocardiales bacterium]
MNGVSEKTHHHVIIIGTGFAGLGMGIRLHQHGMTDFVLLERAAEVGGTWRDNRYPGCACDVPSQLYSFSFELNPTWSRSFSGQQEIWDYLRHCVDRYGLGRYIRFHHEVLDAAWDHSRRRWRVHTNCGELTCDVLITGTGALSEPNIPDIPGLASFGGAVFHSARWAPGYELRDRRVAVVGTGASAIQFVPRIQPEVTSLTLFQRTPAWIMPRGERDIGGLEQKLYRALPVLQRLIRAGIYWGRESLVPGFAVHPRLLVLAEMIARAHLRRGVPDPALRAKLTPDYTIGCKRILISSDYLPTLTKPNVQVVTSALTRVGADWAQAADGTRAGVDVIIFGTGFHVTDMPMATRIRGRDGRTLDEVWSSGAQAHRGTTIAGFPNLFMLVGPNNRARTHLVDLHDRVPGGVHPRRLALPEALRVCSSGGPAGGADGLQPVTPAPDGRHGVDLGRMRELVSRRPRQQHHPVADVHLAIPPRHPQIRPHRIPNSSRPPHHCPHPPPPCSWYGSMTGFSRARMERCGCSWR